MINWRGKPDTPVRAVLDLGYLERLVGHLGHDVTQELLADGMLELADRLTRVEDLAEAGDIDGLLTLTHDIAGASGHLGLSQLSSAAMDANRLLREAKPGDAQGHVRPLLDSRAPSVDALGRFCRESSAR